MNAVYPLFAGRTKTDANSIGLLANRNLSRVLLVWLLVVVGMLASSSVKAQCTGTAVAYLQDFEGANALTYISANVYQPGQCSNGTIRTYTGGNHSGTKALYNTTTESCGSVYAALVWQNPTAITVTPNTSYTISYDITQEAASCMSNLSVTANGTTIGGPVSTPNSGGAWTFYTYSYVWNSGSATSLNVGIVNATACGAGNDFSLDNIKVVGATNTCADLSMAKSGPTTATIGSPVTYTLVVTNTGSVSANGATISDPAVANFIASAVSCAGTTGGAVCPASPTVASLQAGSLSIPTLPSGGSVTLLVTGTVSGSGTINNIASVSVPAGLTDSSPGDNTATAVTGVGTPTTDLSIVKNGPVSVAPNSTVTYTLTISNIGTQPANGAVVTDPSVANFTPTTVVCSGATGGAVCPVSPTVAGLQSGLNIPTLPGGGVVTLTITGTAGASGTITNVATVATPAGVNDSNPANNTATRITSIVQPVSVTNTCPASTVDLTAHLQTTPPTGTTVTWHTGTPATAANQISNPISVSVSGTYYAAFYDAANSCYSGTAPLVVTIVPCNTNISIVKTPASSTVSAGGAVSYTLTITNQGSISADGAIVTDPAVTNFTATSVFCAGTTGGATCPITPTVTGLQGSGLIIPILPSGSTVQLVVTGTAGTSGTIVNVASVAPPAGITDTNPADNSSTAVTTIPATADLAVIKTGSTSAVAGGAVSYTLVFTNNGTSAANGATVSDPVVPNFTATGVSCVATSGGAACPAVTVASLQAGTVTIPTFPANSTVTLVVTGTAGTSGTITNIASISAPAGVTDSNPANNSSTAVTPITPTADLAIVKTGSTSAVSGGAVTYTLVITNNGPSAANNATVSDPAVANLTVTGVSCIATSGGASCPATTVAGLQAGTVSIPAFPANSSITLEITGTAGSSGQITNVATVSAPAGVTDSNPANNSSTAVTPINTPATNLAIVKTGSTSAVAGGTVTYTLVITNSGPSAANGATVSDPAVANFTASSVSCAGTSGGATCPTVSVASLQAGSVLIPNFPATSSVSLVVTGTAGSSGTIINIASVSAPAGVTDTNPSDNSSTAVTPITSVADLAIVKTGSTSAVSGGTVTYTLVVTNNGPSAANNAIVTDPAVANFTATSVTCSGASAGAVCPSPTVASLQSGLTIATLPSGGSLTLVVTGTAGNSGTITNIATVTPPVGTTDTNPGNNSSTAVTPITPATNLAITKTGTATATVGGSVTYTLVVSNNGPTAANGSTVTDPAVANFNATGVTCSGASGGAVCPSPTVASLQSGLTIATFPANSSLTLVVTGTATNSGQITNIASVTTPAGVTDSNPSDNSATAVTGIGTPVADVAIVKTGSTSAVAGSAVTYTLVVSNSGPQDANGSTVTDPVVANFTATGVTCSGASGGAVCPSPTVASLQSGLTIATLPAGSSLTLVVTGTAGTSGTITNIASVVPPAGTTDSNPGNNSSTAVTPITPIADLAITKVGTTTAIVGGTVTYTLVVTNNGPSAANGSTVSDPGVANFSASSVSCSGASAGAVCPASPTVAGLQSGLTIPTLPSGGSLTLVVTGTASASGTITNVASVTTPAGVTDNNPGNNSATAVTGVGTPTTDLAIVKTGSTSAVAGGAVTYTLVVTNNGPNAANGSTVTDPSVANFTATGVSCSGASAGAVCPSPTVASLQSGLTIATLPAGGSLTLVVTGTAGASGTIVNIATVAPPAGVTDSNPANNSSTAVTPIGPACPTPIARATVSLCNNETLNLATYVPAGGSFTLLTGAAGSLVGSTFNGIASGAGLYKVGYRASGVSSSCPPDTITVLVRNCTPPTCNYPVNSIVVDANCGTSDGRAVVTLGGIPTNATTSFAWSTGQTGSTITGLAAGVYSVTATVTDGANICTVVDSIQVNNIGGPVAELKLVTAANCTTNGAASLSIVSGTGPFTVSWSGTASGSLSNVSLGAVTITNLPAGPYVFQISSAASATCYGYLSVNIPRNDAAKIALTATPTNATACGSPSGSITVNVSPAVGVSGPFSFSLNGLLIGSSSLPTYTFSNLPGGVYTVSVGSAGGCTTAQVPVTITETGAPAITGWTSVNPACPTDQGKLVFAGGQSGTTFQVREATTGALLSTVNGTSSTTLVLSAGTYVVQSTSGTCTSVQTLTITRPQDIDFNVQYKAETCASGGVGNSDGSLSVVQINGGTAPYTIVVTNSQGQVIPAANLTSLPAGNYSVNVTDANGCSGSQGTLVTVPPCGLKCPALTFNTSVVDAQCGLNNGSAIAQLLNAPAGAAFTYAWSNGQNGPSITGLASGVYSVTAILTATGIYSGCRYVDSVNVNAIGGPVFTVAPLSPASCTAANGTAIANIISGTGPFTIAWTGPTSGSVSAPNVAGITITGLKAGDYVFTITGSTSACQGVYDVTIPSSPGNLTATATATNVTSCGASNGQIAINVSGGVGPFAYSVNGYIKGYTTTRNLTVAGLPAGTYLVEVTDVNGCTTSTNVLINTTGQPALTGITSTNPTCPQQNGTITVPAGGTDVYTVTIAGTATQIGQTSAGATYSVPGGTYLITRTTSSSCVSVTTVTISQPDGLDFNIQYNNPNCLSPASGSLTVIQTTGGTVPPPYSMTVTGASGVVSSTGLSASALPAGSYTVTIGDGNGCTFSNSITLSNPTSCSADLSIVKTGSTTALSGGPVTYTLVVSNAGPSAANGATVTDPSVANFTATGVTCSGASGSAVCPTTPTVAGLQSGLTIPTLPSGGSVTLVVTGTAGASGTITNIATVTPPASVTDTNPGNNSSTAVTPITPVADLAITKTGTTTAIVGGTVTYTLVVTNAGPSAANGAIVTDPSVANFNASNVSCAGATGGAVCPSPTVASLQSGLTIATLPSGGSLTLVVTGTATGTPQITNVASVTTPAGVTDTNPLNNSATAVTGVGTPVADVAIVKTGSTTATAGGPVTYTLVISNNGPNAANGATVTDPAVANFTATTVSCSGASNGAVCPAPTVATLQSGLTIATLPSGGSLTLVVTGTAGTSGTIVNVASIAPPAGTTDSNPANNSSTAVTPITPVADLAITKVGTTTAIVGGTVTYTLVVSNSGPSAADGSIVTDPAATNFNATGVTCSGASGGAVCPSPTVASLQSGLTIATLPSGGSLTLVVTGTASGTAQITNVASVTTPAGIIDSNPLNNSATAVTGVGTPVADLAIVKTGSSTAVAGGPVTYTLVVSNAGPNAANGATVTDPAVANFTATGVSCSGASNGAVCPSPTVASLQSGLTIATLPSGGSLTLVVTGTAGASGTIVNVATVATPPGVTDSNPGNNSSTAVTPITPPCQPPVLTVSAAVCSTVAGGTYTATFVSSGTVTVTGGTISGNTLTASSASGNMVVTATSAAGCTTSLTVVAPATCPTNCTLTPTLTVGQPVCLGTGSYAVNVSGSNGTITTSAGTLVGNTLTVPVGTSVVVTITGATGCGSYSLAVASPASCTPTDCSASPLVSISGPACAGTGFYSVNYTAPSGVTVTASAGTVAAGVISNIPIGTTVSVTATNGSCPPQSVTIASPTNCNVADLAITKVGTTTATVGGTVTYTLVVTNNGPAAANGAIVTDPSATNFNATGVTCLGASGGAVCPSPTVASLQSGLTIATLPSGGSLTLVVTGTASGTAQITNVASVTTPAGIIDSNPLNNSATAVTGVGTPVADLAIVKTGSTTAVAGGPVTYTLVVSNAGPNAANGATVTDPAVANFTATGVSCSGASNGAVCPSPTVATLQSGLTIATLPSGGSLTLVVTGTAGASGTIVNVATVATPPGTIDSNPGDNSSTAITPISPACPTPVNRANVALCNTEVLDLAAYVPAGGSFTLLTGSAGSLSGSTFNGIVSGVGLFKVGYRASGVSANCAPDTITVIVRNCGVLPCNYPVNSIVVDANCGSSDGRAQVTVGGIPTNATTSFAWSNGQTGAAITGLAAGVYSFTATIADGANICTVVDSIQVNNIGGPVAELKLVTSANCTTNGAASLSIVSGVGPFTITWTGASSGTLNNVALGPVTISNLPAGAYSFKISSAATPNCYGYLSVNVPRNDAARLTLTATPTAATACNSPTGSIQIAVTPQAGVTAPFSYSLDGQLIGSSNLPSYTFTNLPAGVYTVAVGSANGCATASLPVRIDQTGAAPITGVSTVNPACPTDQGQIIFAGGQSGTTYQVRDALTGTVIATNISGATASTMVVSAGTYSIQTTSGSCMSSTLVTINRPQDIDINIQYTAETCGSGGVGNGDGSLSAIQITGGTKPYTVLVTNSQGQVIAPANFNSLPAGNYTVNVVDANGCTGSQGALVTVPPCTVVCPKLTFSSVVVDAQCGSSNGTATVQLLNPPAGSTVTYLWSNGQNTPGISGLASGIYSVTAQISTTGIYSGCRYVDTVHVNAIGGPVFTVTSQTPASCTAANGSAVINLQSGTGPFNVSWTGATSGSQTVPNLGTFTVNGLAAGSYTFTVTGAGSTSTCQSFYTITLPGTSGSLSATPTPTNVSSCNASDGQIAVNVSGGVGPFIYTVNGFVQGVTSVRNFSVMNLPAGIYYVQVTDKNGCTTTSSNVLINTTGQPAIAGFTRTNATCPEQNGTIAFNGSGVASDQYKVTIAGTATQIGQTAGNVAASYSVPAGTYLITRTTSSSCVSVTTITISQPSGLEYNIQYGNPTCAAPNSASLAVIQATGGTAPLSYTVTSATGVVTSLTGLTSGSYTVTLGDANGCTLSKVVSLTTGANCSTCFSAFVYLQGALVNNIGVWPTSPTTGANGEPLMRDDLRAQGIIPLSDPYRQAPYNATFTHVSNPYNETISAAMLVDKGDSSVVDWVFLEFRDKTNPSVVKYTRSALVLRNGTIIDFDGSRCLHVDHMALDDYYVAVRHRNHLGVMTQTTRTIGTGAPADVTVDFRKLTPAEIWHDTSDPNQVALYGDVERRDISWAPGYYALWGGNANRDHSTIFQGQTNDPIEVYNQTSTATGNFFNNPAYILNGYYSGDVNMNGQTIFQGQNNEPIIIYNIMIQHPRNFLNNPAFIIKEQLP